MSYHRRIFLTCDEAGCEEIEASDCMSPGVERFTIGRLRQQAYRSGWVTTRLPPPRPAVLDHCPRHAALRDDSA